ncbi:MAG TPA: recombination mediator RecR [Bacillota bacterium]|nr:recombination mediator RecR [Bacillota bacterium]
MSSFPAAIENLILQLARLPGVGPKTAQRLAFHLLSLEPSSVRELTDSIMVAKETIGYCEQCFNLAEGKLCRLCQDSNRKSEILCVVEDPRDIAAMERTHDFKGLYHVLQGAISPMEGIGPDQLRVRELLERLRDNGIKEVIIATNPNIEGEATAMYLARLIKPLGILVTRLAHGLPIGGDLEYADEMTISRALEHRRQI